MTLKHKIKLVFARIGWWLRITEKAKDHYEALQDYYYLYDLYNTVTKAFLDAHARRPDDSSTCKLKGQIELLAEILDIRR
jgi:hypothetical protein